MTEELGFALRVHRSKLKSVFPLGDHHAYTIIGSMYAVNGPTYNKWPVLTITAHIEPKIRYSDTESYSRQTKLVTGSRRELS